MKKVFFIFKMCRFKFVLEVRLYFGIFYFEGGLELVLGFEFYVFLELRMIFDE